MNKNFVKNLSLWLLLGIFSGYLFLNLYQSDNLTKDKKEQSTTMRLNKANIEIPARLFTGATGRGNVN